MDITHIRLSCVITVKGLKLVSCTVTAASQRFLSLHFATQPFNPIIPSEDIWHAGFIFSYLFGVESGPNKPCGGKSCSGKKGSQTGLDSSHFVAIPARLKGASSCGRMLEAVGEPGHPISRQGANVAKAVAWGCCVGLEPPHRGPQAGLDRWMEKDCVCVCLCTTLHVYTSSRRFQLFPFVCLCVRVLWHGLRGLSVMATLQGEREKMMRL